MTQEKYRAVMEDVIYLSACAVKGETPEIARVDGMDLSRLYKAANRHLLTGIVCYALEASRVYDPAFVQAKSKAIRKAILFDAERAKVLQALDEAGIWYMPMKGSLLKDLYPAIGMRQMADNDILYDVTRSEEVRSIMESLGFETVQYVQNNYNHDHYDKEPVCNFEMHRALFPPSVGDELFAYYEQVKERLVKDEGNKCGYHFTDEDFYVYMIAHEYKHFSNSGTGLRSVLDTYVYCTSKGEALDWAYIEGETRKLGIEDFEKANRSLALHLFGGGQLSGSEQEMLDYFLSSGTYGTRENFVQNRLKKYGGGRWGKLRYVFHRLFLPMESVKSAFPMFIKVPVLLPFLPIYRLGRGLTTRRARMKAELRALHRIK